MSMDSVFLVALLAELSTAVPEELNIRMAGAVRLRPQTIMDLPSSHMAPQQHCLFSRTRRHFAVRLHLSTTIIIMGEDLLLGSRRMDPRELNIRADFTAGAVRLHPSTTIMGEDLHRSRRMDPQDHRLFSRTRRLGSSSEGRTGGVCLSTRSARRGALVM